MARPPALAARGGTLLAARHLEGHVSPSESIYPNKIPHDRAGKFIGALVIYFRSKAHLVIISHGW